MTAGSPQDPDGGRKARTREAILRALAEVVVAEGVAAMSVQQVADRAGITHRTVYRHFPDRQALLDGLGGWVQAQMQEGLDARDIDDIDAVRAAAPWVFERFDELGAPAAAMARISLAEDVRSVEHERRTEQFRTLLAPALAGYGDDAEAIFAVLRHLLSSVTWWVAHTEFDLDGHQTGQAVATVIDAVVNQANRQAS